jgi:dTDP-4-dehydrorhamnose reductase
VILVFGGGGQLGRELVRTAAQRAVPLATLTHGDVDIADKAAVTAAMARLAPALVVNAAAYTKVDLAESEPDAARRANEIGPCVVAAACAEVEVPMVHISTDYVFDGRKKTPYRECDAVGPLNVYGRTKASGEEAVRQTLKRHIILRTAWVYSEFGNNFLRTVLRLAQAQSELRIVADQYGSPTSAGEIAEAILHLAPLFLRDDTLAGTYHFTATGRTTWHGFASRIVAAAAPFTGRNLHVSPIRSEDYPTAAKRPVNSCLDCRSFINTFQFAPRRWTNGVDATTRRILRATELTGSDVA